MNDFLEPIRVLLVDANVLFRSGIARLIETQPDLQVVGEADNHAQALQLAQQLQPDVMILDVDWNGSECAAVIRAVKRQLAGLRIVALAAEILAEELLACVLAGADGYLQKNITPEELFCRLRGLNRNEAAISLTTAATLMRRLSVSNCTLCLRASPSPDLTARESEVLELVARGMTNKRIGERLQISEHTVRNHLCSIYQKLNLENRLQVAVYSVAHGIVDVNQIAVP